MKTRTSIALVVCFAVLAFALSLSVVKAAGKPPAKGRLQGKVTDAVTSLPIVNATVEINADFTTKTGTDGIYEITGLPAAGYTVTTSQAGYATQTAPVTISSGATTVQDFALVPPLNTVPEVPLGTLAVSLAMIGTLVGYIAIPKLRKRK